MPFDDELRAYGAEQHGVVTHAQAVWSGASRERLRRRTATGVLVRLQPGAFLVPTQLDDRSHLAAACLRCPQAVVSHRAAANLWKLDGAGAVVVEVSVPPNVRMRGSTVHRTVDLAGFEVVEVDGLRCTDPTRTLCDVGAVVDDDELERAVECALRRRLTSVPRLRWRLGQLARKGRAGPPSLRRVLDRRPEGAPPTESELETRFLQCIRQAGLPEPDRQHVVPLGDGTVARLDVAWPGQKVFAELDGWESHRHWWAFRRDRARQNLVVVQRWTPLRFTWPDVHDDPAGTAAVCGAALGITGG